MPVAVIGIPRALLRTALVAWSCPRWSGTRTPGGWHDRAARTIVVRTRCGG